MKLVGPVRSSGSCLADPLRCATRAQDEPEFFVSGFYSAVFDVGAGQAAAANETIAWLARPTHFHDDHAHAAFQTQATTNHAGIANLEAVRIFGGDLYRRAGAVCVAGSDGKQPDQPVAGSLPQQIIRPAQRNIFRNVGPSRRARARFSFGEDHGPCLVKFAHYNLREHSQTFQNRLHPSLTKARDVIMAFQTPPSRCPNSFEPN